jgi:hypothetical protein
VFTQLSIDGQPEVNSRRADLRHYFLAADKLGIISLPPLENLLVVGEPTGMMTSDKREKVFFLELSFRPTTDTHLCSRKGGRID